MTKVPVKIGNKLIGMIIDNVFVKKVKKSKHLFRAIPAWGIDKNKYDEMIEPQVKIITVIDTEDRKAYMVTNKKFKDKAIVRNYGYGDQYLLPLKYWKDSKEGFQIENRKVRTSKKEILRIMKGQND